MRGVVILQILINALVGFKDLTVFSYFSENYI